MVEISKLDSIKVKLGFSHAVSNSISKIWTMWNDDIQCTVAQTLDQLIVMNCNHGDVDGDFLLAAVYAKCSKVERRELWGDLVSSYE